MADSTTSSVGSNLRREREARGWSRETLARESGTSLPTIARTELYGKEPRISTLTAWADALGVSLTVLLGSEEGTAA